jgi:sigma-B regulation protein RsbU (phosphoserine phosphatase)
MAGDAVEVDPEVRRVRAAEDVLVTATAQGTERLDRLVRLARRLFGVSVATVTMLDRDTQWFLGRAGVAVEAAPRAHSPCNATIAAADTYVLEDLSADDRFAGHPMVAGDPHLRFYAGHPLEAPGSQPVGTLCLLDERPRTFSDADRALLSELAAWAQDELAHSEELDRAAEIQRSLLPGPPPGPPGYELAARCRPARAVGGDFYDWHALPDGIGFTLGDVMGKGIGAAILMATARAALRGAASPDPAATLDGAAAALEGDLGPTNTLVTLLHGHLDAERGRLRHVDAGHGLALVLRAGGGWEPSRGGGLPLGVLPEQTWDTVEVDLAPGDAFVVVSDGVLDLLGDPLAGLGEVAELLRDCRSAQEVVDRVDAAAAGAEPGDDVTVQVVRRREAA